MSISAAKQLIVTKYNCSETQHAVLFKVRWKQDRYVIPPAEGPKFSTTQTQSTWQSLAGEAFSTQESSQ